MYYNTILLLLLLYWCTRFHAYCSALARYPPRRRGVCARGLLPRAQGWHNIYTKILTSPLDWKMIIYIRGRDSIQVRLYYTPRPSYTPALVSMRAHIYIIILNEKTRVYSVCVWVWVYGRTMLLKGIFLGSGGGDMCSPGPRSAIVCHSVLGESFWFATHCSSSDYTLTLDGGA